MKQKALLFAALLCSITLFSQTVDSTKSGLYGKAMVGVAYHFVPLHNDEASDLLLRNAKFGFVARPLALNYTFKNGFGLEGSFTAMYTVDSWTKTAFFEEMENQYSDDNDFISPQVDEEEPAREYTGAMTRATGGITYAFHGKKFITSPKLLFGATRVMATGGQVFMKDKITNDYKSVEYSHNLGSDDSKTYFLINPAVSMEYFLSEQLFLVLDCSYYFYQSDLVYTETKRNYNQGETVEREISYAKGIHALELSFGITYKISRGKRSAEWLND